MKFEVLKILLYKHNITEEDESKSFSRRHARCDLVVDCGGVR